MYLHLYAQMWAQIIIIKIKHSNNGIFLIDVINVLYKSIKQFWDILVWNLIYTA